MTQTGWTDEQLQIFETEVREQERFEQAYMEYSSHVVRVPIRPDFDSDEDYETAFSEWSDIADELLAHAQELERVK